MSSPALAVVDVSSPYGVRKGPYGVRKGPYGVRKCVERPVQGNGNHGIGMVT